MKLRIGQLCRDAGTQMREKIDLATVGRYADEMRRGVVYDPIEVVSNGKSNWPWDGFHRIEAALSVPVEEIECNVVDGTLQDAIRKAIGANVRHGLWRSKLTKRNAVMAALRDPEWSKWSTRVIAEHCGVSHVLVADVRKETTVSGLQSGPVKGADGRTINVTNIGKSKPKATGAEVRDGAVVLHLADGRAVQQPVANFERLRDMAPGQLGDAELVGDGEGVRWSAVDEDLATGAFVRDAKPASRWASDLPVVSPSRPSAVQRVAEVQAEGEDEPTDEVDGFDPRLKLAELRTFLFAQLRDWEGSALPLLDALRAFTRVVEIQVSKETKSNAG